MKNLIEALQIFLKYKDAEFPVYGNCGLLYVVGITEDEVSAEDKSRLGELGFFWDEGGWQSSRFGSV
jgi:hypothetical protein